MMRRTPALHRFPLRVYYEDTDAGGIVYHAQYLCFAERARTEMLRQADADHSRLREQHGGMFAVRRVTADFRRPAQLDDQLVVESGVENASGVRLILWQNIKKNDQPLVIIEVELVFITPDLRPRRLPVPLVAAFRNLAALP